MITVIRNDREAKYTHDVYDIKIKEELPLYKLIGTTRNEGICLYESPNYGAVAQTFDIIVNSIMNGEKSILIIPPVVDKGMSKEEFIKESDIHDFIKVDEDNPIPLDCDIYGRPLNCNSVYEQSQPYQQDFYAWETPNSTFNPLNKNSFDNKFLGNQYPYQKDINYKK